MIEYGFVAARVISGPLSDLYKKRLAERNADPLYIVLFTYAFITVAAAAALFLLPIPTAGAAFWRHIVLASVFDTAGMVLVVMSLGVTDLSVFGPLNAYKPALALALGAAFLHEKPGPTGLAGVAIIVAGSILLGYAPGEARRSISEMAKSHGVWFRLSGIASFCVGVIFLKKAVVESSPFTTLFFWAAFGLAICVACAPAFRPRAFSANIKLLRRHAGDYAMVCLLMGIMQAMTLLAFRMMFVGYALALFQLSAILSILFGHRFFGEKHIAFRLASAAIMSAGALLIVLCPK
ncbi:MAG: EamA family transporter [bacterium]